MEVDIDLLSISVSPRANTIAKNLRKYHALVIGDMIFIPKGIRPSTTTFGISRQSGVNETLIFQHPYDPNYFCIECPD